MFQLRLEGRRQKAGTFDKRAQLGPREVGVDPPAKAAIRASNDVLAAVNRGVPKDAAGDGCRVFDKV
jgi:hypothetical protein